MTLIQIYDFEVFRYDWLVVIADYNNREFKTIVNNPDQLIEYFNVHKNDIWVGFNNKNYDQYIFKGILTGHNPYMISRHIIANKMPGFSYRDDMKKIYMSNYDVYNTLQHGLKFYEGSMGDSIEESSVSFDIERKLTEEELKEVEKYCRHDVEETIKIFFKRKDDFVAQLGLIKLTGKPHLMPRTQTQIASQMLNAEALTDTSDEFDVDIPPTLNLSKYSYIKEWYLDSNNMNYEKSLTTKVAGVDHIFGFGGLHGAREKYHHKGKILVMDVASLYPSLMINYNLLSRAVVDPTIYKELRDKRLQYKKEHNNLHLPLKLILNKTYGAMKDRNNTLYDPRNANRVCIYGQLLLLDLIEKLEPYCTLIQSNTDGLFITDYVSKVYDIAEEWQGRTHLQLEFTEAVEIWQKDVNNYVLTLQDGSLKTKGAYVKELSDLDYGDYPIINKAIINYLTKNIPVEQTINSNTSLIDFQMVCKITGKFSAIYYGNTRLQEKCVRVFAGPTTNPGIFKQHAESLSFYKIPNTPEHVFIDNTDIHGKLVPSTLDKKFYIDLAKRRLEEFI